MRICTQVIVSIELSRGKHTHTHTHTHKHKCCVILSHNLRRCNIETKAAYDDIIWHMMASCDIRWNQMT